MNDENKWRAVAYLNTWSEGFNVVRRTMVEVEGLRVIVSEPRSRFLPRTSLPSAVAEEVLERAGQITEKLFEMARVSAQACLNELDRSGLFEAFSDGGASSLVRWMAHSALSRALLSIPMPERGHDLTLKSAIMGVKLLGDEYARVSSYADVVAYGAYRDAGAPLAAIIEAHRSGSAPATDLAESLLRHSLHLLNQPYGAHREDASALRSMASALGELLIPDALREDPALAAQCALADETAAVQRPV